MSAFAGALVVAAASAWACVSGPSVTLNPTNAKPGQEVSVAMRDFRKADPIQVRWNALDGPVLATFNPDPSGSTVTGKFTVPEATKAGNHIVIFSQTGADGKLTQLPVRALLNVSSATGASPVVGAGVTPVDASRPSGLVTTDNDVSTGTMALVALGVAGMAMFVVGIGTLLAGRKAEAGAPVAARVKK